MCEFVFENEKVRERERMCVSVTEKQRERK